MFITNTVNGCRWTRTINIYTWKKILKSFFSIPTLCSEKTYTVRFGLSYGISPLSPTTTKLETSRETYCQFSIPWVGGGGRNPPGTSEVRIILAPPKCRSTCAYGRRGWWYYMCWTPLSRAPSFSSVHISGFQTGREKKKVTKFHEKFFWRAKCALVKISLKNHWYIIGM